MTPEALAKRNADAMQRIDVAAGRLEVATNIVLPTLSAAQARDPQVRALLQREMIADLLERLADRLEAGPVVDVKEPEAEKRGPGRPRKVA